MSDVGRGDAASTDAYGEHILSTGDELAEWEAVFSRYIYQSRFEKYDHVVEIGPGRCHFIRQSPEAIIGVDNAPTLVSAHTEAGLNLRLGSAEQLPFADGEIDAAYACWLLEHLYAPDACLREVWRILRPCGYALFIVPSESALLHGFYDDFTHVRPFTMRSLTQLAHASRFSKCHVQPLFWTRGLRRLLPVVGASGVLRALAVGDTKLRRFGLNNGRNLMLEVWKD